MRSTKVCLALLVAVGLIGCSSSVKPAADVTGSIRQALDQAGLKDVSVKEDDRNGAVTLSGHVPSDSEKTQAEAIAKQFAGALVVSNEVAILPPGQESAAKSIDSDLDKAIEKNLDAALIRNRLQKHVKYSVKNGVVTLTGDVDTQRMRADSARIAAAVPNVTQVVNEVQVKRQKASSTP